MKQLRYKGQYRSKPRLEGLTLLLAMCLVEAALYIAWTPVTLHDPRGPQVTRVQAQDVTTQATVTPLQVTTPQTPKDKILAAWGPVEGPRALRVAFCESSLNPSAAHTHSSAKGLFQIIRGTWNGYKCAGSPLNADDNIACAYKIYQANGWNHTSSWAASYPCHGIN